MDICREVAPIRAAIAPGRRKVGDTEIDVTEGRSAACHLHPESTPGGAR
jgi:hypothetical protein